MVGRWHAANSSARFMLATSWREARDLLPAAGAVFLEFTDPPNDRPPPESSLGSALVLCVAAPAPPPDGIRTLVESPPVESRWRDLLRWVDARVAGGDFDLSEAEAAFRELGGAAVFQTIGAVLAFAGLVDHFGAQRLLDADPHSVGRTWLHRALDRPERGRVPDWLRRSAWELVVRLAENALVQSDEPWHCSRPREEWESLVPEDLSASPDVAGVLRLLEERPRGLRAAEVAAVRDRLAPAAPTRVKALVDARLLQHVGDGAFAFRPEWLLHLAVRAAIEGLLDGPPSGWGAAALRLAWGGYAVRRLRARVGEGGPDPVTSSVEHLDPAVPETVAAVEAAFRAVGLALLDGAEVDTALLTRLWNAQMGVAGQPYLSPSLGPRLSADSSQEVDPAAGAGTWLLACLAISEKLPASVIGDVPAAYAPWHGGAEEEALRTVLSQAESDFRHAGWSQMRNRAVDWALGAYALGDRLIDVVGPVRSAGEIADLQAPGAIARAVRDGDSLAGCLRFPGDHLQARAAVAEAAARHGLDLAADVAPALWEACAELDAMWVGPFFRLQEEAGAREDVEFWWAHAPPAVLAGPLATQVRVGRQRIPWRLLSETQWAAVLEVLLEEGPHEVLKDIGVLELMPHPLLDRALRSDRLNWRNRPIREFAWRRAPQVAEEGTRRLLEAGRVEEAVDLLYPAPLDRPTPLLEYLAVWGQQEGREHEEVQRISRWLRRRVAERSTDWRDVYAVFHSIVDPA